MKTRYLYLTFLFLLGLSVPAHAQSEAGAFDGVQGSLNEFMDAAAETSGSLKPIYDEIIRRAWLFGSDIIMDMNAVIEGDSIGNRSGWIWMNTQDRDVSLSAEFDWQNMACSMRMKSAAAWKSYDIFPGYRGTEKIETDITIYLDAQGYWYVPIEKDYIRVHPTGELLNTIASKLKVGIEDAIYAEVTEMLDQLAFLALIDTDPSNEWIKDFIPDEFIGAADGGTSGLEQLLKPLLEKLAKLQYMQTSGFTFINFAFFFSPTLARSHFSPQEQTVNWGGQDYCTKMTLASGYLVVFDRYGRLIHLKDTDGDTADYRYDKDVTVNFPFTKFIIPNFIGNK